MNEFDRLMNQLANDLRTRAMIALKKARGNPNYKPTEEELMNQVHIILRERDLAIMNESEYKSLGIKMEETDDLLRDKLLGYKPKNVGDDVDNNDDFEC